MRIPEHIAVIPDGNRRWAVAHGMAKGDGYHYGLRPGLLLLRRAKELRNCGKSHITGLPLITANAPANRSGRFAGRVWTRRSC